jgi:hypothetical protein
MKGRHDAVVQVMEKLIKKIFQDSTVTNKEPASRHDQRRMCS